MSVRFGASATLPNGVAVLTAGSSGLIAVAGVTGSSLIGLALIEAGGTPGGLMATQTPGSGFTITSSSSTDTSSVFWSVMKF